jgi:isoquinoline 1-oxidoreductase alpha subunit
MSTFNFVLNGQLKTVEAADDMPLLWVLRDLLGLTGTKYGCGVGNCHVCIVHLNGDAMPSCQIRMGEQLSGGGTVTTIEGLFDVDGVSLHPVQKAWIEEDVPQCGFCQGGQIMQAVDLVNKKGPAVTDDDIDGILNICRCGTYGRIRKAIMRAATGEVEGSG